MATVCAQFPRQKHRESDEDQAFDDTAASQESDTVKNTDPIPKTEGASPAEASDNETAIQRTITEQVRALNLKSDIADKDLDEPPREEAEEETKIELAVDETPRSPRAHRSRSSSASGSDDVVVFTGRSKPSNVAPALTTTKPERPSLLTKNSGNSTVRKGVRYSSRQFEIFPKHITVDRLFAQSVLDPGSNGDLDIRSHKVAKRKSKPESMSYAELMADNQLSDEEDAIVQDYIANMKDEEDDAADCDKVYDDWASEDLDDLNNLSTSEEAPDKIERILASRERDSGLQYLVVGTGQPVDEARWITQEILNSQDAIDVLRDFEARQEKMLAEIEEDTDSSEDDASSENSEEAGFNEYLDNLESEEEERDNIARCQARMTDEQIASALAKQEELGMDADEVLLFDGMVDDGVLAEFASSRRSGKTKGSTKEKSKKNRRADHFPSASAFADALDQDPYGAFDVMDFERPSLKPKKKGRKSALPFQLDDEELQLQLEQSWENDRTKKADKKREREALRAQGLLGSKNGKVNLAMKYRNGMSTANVHHEVKLFLKSSQETLSLTPMDNLQRRQVHVIAQALKLKSKSHGSGSARYPVLSKTRFTPVFDIDFSESELDEIFGNAHSTGSLFRAARKGGKGAFAKVKTTGGSLKKRQGGGNAAAGYRDGDVVGASAPEIGIENRGRAMLEKMGWTAGMGLGVSTNKGIIVPVQHVVKNTKAGLG
ncbi:putative r3h and g-patch domain-containing protein [Phaeomoniella chlamydospora]|uniref:Putative r3h and g-patch domain-containing protein n=1 Tax=Phaeomoniella chlamydospora TaxID=158046 RepID=A0A0G2GD63_PHACM|nr:putative r3h and g-patch domain-containing protein [Phaeomoniella chlamydospora]